MCNELADDDFGYRYHTSDEPPYIIQCLVGEVDEAALPRISPLVDGNNQARPSGTPPQGGVTNLVFTESASGARSMTYEYQGTEYYIQYTPSASQENCYDFETKTVTNNGQVQTGTYCRD